MTSRAVPNLIVLIAVAAAAGTACSRDEMTGIPPGPPPPQQLLLEFRNVPRALAAGRVPDSAIQVAIVDSSGRVQPRSDSITIALAENPAQGTLSGTVTMRALNGVAEFADIRLDRASLAYRLLASAPGLDTTFSDIIAVMAGSGARLRFATEPAGILAQDTFASIDVEVIDSLGNVDITLGHMVTMRIGANPSGASVMGTFTAQAVRGVARFAALSVNRGGSGFTLVASAPGLGDAVSQRFDVRPRVPARLAFTSQPLDAAEGDPIVPFVNVAVLDSGGTVVVGWLDSIVMSLTPSSNGGVLGGHVVARPAQGLASFSDLSVDRAGRGYRLVAGMTNVASATSDTFTVVGELPLAQGATMAAGSEHTCALDGSHRAWCWGSDGVGQLGTGRVLASDVPVRVDTTETFTSISSALIDIGEAGSPARTATVCGLTTTGRILCWGRSYSLVPPGSGITMGSSPADISHGRRWSMMALDFRSICGLSEGKAFCWGMGGDYYPPGSEGSWTPVAVAPNFTFTEFHFDDRVACGLTTGHEVWCARDGQTQPTRIAGPALETMRWGPHGCGLKAGQAWCWGVNGSGELGDGTTIRRDTMVRVQSTTAFVDLALTYGRSCALDADHGVWCWGGGQLSPRRLDGLPPIASFASPSCGLSTSGETWCWTNTPHRFDSPVNFRQLRPGAGTDCGIATDGSAWCWGQNYSGQFGDGHPLRRLQPTASRGTRTFTEISADWQSCALATDGAPWCWGVPKDSSVPSRVPGLPPLVRVSGGAESACGLTAAAEAWCWSGADSTPAPIPSLRFADLSVGSMNRCGLTRSGAVWCWTSRMSYEGPRRTAPAQVSANHRFVSFASHNQRVCGIKASGDVWCWSGTLQPSLVQAPATGTLRFKHVAVGSGAACGITTTDETWCWGSSSYGALGNGTNGASAVPVRVSGNHAFTSLTSGIEHFCGRKTDGALWCWGGNWTGQLGNGTTDNSNVPVRVAGGGF